MVKLTFCILKICSHAFLISNRITRSNNLSQSNLLEQGCLFVGASFPLENDFNFQFRMYLFFHMFYFSFPNYNFRAKPVICLMLKTLKSGKSLPLQILLGILKLLQSPKIVCYIHIAVTKEHPEMTEKTVIS